nr:hypothetical protein [uncultured Roseateles sp.]
MNAASHDRPRLTVGVAGACYYLPIERFLATTDRFVEKVTGDCVAERRFIAMKDTVSAAHHANATRWLSGHGPFLDISAYAMACADLPDTLPLYLVFNDTLFTRHAWRLASRRLARVRESLAAFGKPAAAAEVHPSTDLLLLDAHNPTRRHLSTFCLMLNNSGFRLLRRLLTTLPESDDHATVQAWIDARMNEYPALAPLLHVHLTGPRSPWSWKQDAADLLQRKAVTVIFEYLFTVELLSRGVGMPINNGFGYRLAARLGRHG